MKKLSNDIVLGEEVAAIAEYIGQTWEPIGNLRSLVEEIRVAAFHSARGLIDNHRVWEVAHGLEEARETLLSESLGPTADPLASLYDAPCQFINGVMSRASDLYAAGLELDGPWDFSRRVSAVKISLGSAYPDLAAARPKGWAELNEGYCDFDGQEEYDPRPARELFKGSSVEETLSGDFTYRVALPYVMYDEVCQSNKASSVLVGAIFAQFLGIAQFLNTEKAIAALMQALPDLQVPKLLFELSFQPTNPHLNALAQMIGPARYKEPDYLKAVAHRATHAALTPEEKVLQEKVHQEKISELIDRIKAESSSGEDVLKLEEEKARNIGILTACLGN